MVLRLDDRRIRYTLFVLLALAINLIDGLVTRSIASSDRRSLVAAAASVDVILVVSLLYYWLLVRPGIRAPATLSFVALLGALHATYFWPIRVPIRAALAGLCELGLLAFVAVRMLSGTRRRSIKDTSSDPVDAIRDALEAAFLPPLAARMLAAEISVLYYALFTWRAKPHIPKRAQAFSIHRQSGQVELLAGLAMACVLEIVPVHLVLHRWSPVAAWIATALGLYSAIWLIGLTRSISLRPILVGQDYLDLRYGLLFRLRIEAHRIARVHPRETIGSPPAVVLPKGSQPNIWIELARDQKARRLFGIETRVRQIGLAADHPSALERALAQIVQPGSPL